MVRHVGRGLRAPCTPTLPRSPHTGPAPRPLFLLSNVLAQANAKPKSYQTITATTVQFINDKCIFHYVSDMYHGGQGLDFVRSMSDQMTQAPREANAS